MLIGVLLASQVGMAKSINVSNDEIKTEGVKNIIILVGDGMGFSQLQLTRETYGHLAMEDMPSTGFELTDSLSGEVTDSAAAGTAIATGFKTYNGMISTVRDNGVKNVTTMLELAKECGKSTGLVTTTRITHATPAVFASHVEDRDSEKEIAPQLLNHKVNVLFGGGKKYFNEDLLKVAEEKGYDIAYNNNSLNSLNSKYSLGLFADSHIPYVLDRDNNTPSLKDMTKKAVELLDKNNNGNGFFLMVEGGRIDHASHGNDIASVLAETKDFDEAVSYCLDYAKKNGDTLVVVLADHETGGLAVGTGYGDPVKEDKILGIKASTGVMANEIKNGKTPNEVLKEYANMPLTSDEIKQIEEAKNSENKYALSNKIADIINNKVGVGFISHKHTGVPVPLIVYGPGSEKFRGFTHHVETSKLITKMMLFGSKNMNLGSYGISSLKGDANGDYKITNVDAYITLMNYVGGDANTEVEKKVDMDNNGLIDYNDVALILKKAEA